MLFSYILLFYSVIFLKKIVIFSLIAINILKLKIDFFIKIIKNKIHLLS